MTAGEEKNIFGDNSFHGGVEMGIRYSERERRAAESLARQKRRVNFMSVGTQVEVLNLVRREQQKEEEEAERKMAEIAAQDAKIAQKYGGPQAWQKIYQGSPDERKRKMTAAKGSDPSALTEGSDPFAEEKRQAALDDQVNQLINDANRRRQKRLVGKQPERSHPIVKQEIVPERRLELELNPKQRRPAGEDWREKLTAGSHWQDALKWFKMTSPEKAAAEAQIADAMNTEIGPVAQALAAQAGWNELEASGKLKQMDFFGYVWPTDEK